MHDGSYIYRPLTNHKAMHAILKQHYLLLALLDGKRLCFINPSCTLYNLI